MISSEHSLEKAVLKPKKSLFPTQPRPIILAGRSTHQTNMASLPANSDHTLNYSNSSLKVAQHPDSQQRDDMFAEDHLLNTNGRLLTTEQAASSRQERLLSSGELSESNLEEEAVPMVAEFKQLIPQTHNLSSQDSLQKVYNRFRLLSLNQPRTQRPEIKRRERLEQRRKP